MNLKFRIFKDRLVKSMVILISLMVFIPLILILFQISKNGIGALSIGFFTNNPTGPGEGGGGILNAMLGSLMLVVLSSLMAVPLGILIGIFIGEIQNKFTYIIKILSNMLQGLPSIVIGIIAYIWVVKPMGGFSAFSGAVALGLMMLPMIITSTEETVKRIPVSLKEGAASLGVNYTRTILKVVLPASLGGIVSGILLGISRIIGETAPLLFTAFGNPFINYNPAKPVDSLPLVIFNYVMSPYDDWHKLAWGASFVLVVFVLFINLFVKGICRRWKIRY